jgi:hypothetical protein
MRQPLHFRPTSAPAPDPRLEQALRSLMLVAVSLVVLMPAARGYSQWLGWTPLWLLGLPAVAWWSLHRFRLPWPSRPRPATPLPRGRRAAIPTRMRRMATSRRLARAA